MKIAQLIIRGFQQFQNFHLDLTDPRTGQPLDKVCFIGPNGTGKSTLLRLIYERVLQIGLVSHSDWFSRPSPVVLGKVRASTGDYWLGGNLDLDHRSVVLNEKLEESSAWAQLVDAKRQSDDTDAKWLESLQSCHVGFDVASRLLWRENDGDVVIFSPPDSSSLLPTNQRLPATTLDQALRMFKEFAVFQLVDTQRTHDFWNVLIYHIKKREEDWQAYLRQPENRRRSVEDVERDFHAGHPEILRQIAELWNRILAPAGLEFDYQAAKKPVQLNENLEAFIKLRSTGQSLEYNALSTGIRNFIFRLGHIFALYFGRDIQRGFLLLDEPENSLYPDFLFDLIDIYQSIIRNTQFFVATHNPIIAAQFRPEERVILEFDSHGHVTPHRGVTPVGDDPNDLLKKDFEVRSLYGREGLVKWERFLQLRRLIKRTADASAKRALIDEYMQIGNAYSFPADAPPQESL